MTVIDSAASIEVVDGLDVRLPPPSKRESGEPAGDPIRKGSRALGAIAAQGSQAVGSFALQFAAARSLGLEGLGQFAVLYGLIVLATAVCSGFVGDSLTVLDRSSTSIRAGLQWWLSVLSVGSGVLCALGAALTGFLTPGQAVAFGIATTTFLVEDTIRRLLMAGLQFWRIVVVDMVAAAVALGVVGLAAWNGTVDLTALLSGLAAGQVAALVAGWYLLASTDRLLVPMQAAAVRLVAGYGSWRALQQAVRAGTLALVRVICLFVVTKAAVGELEAARIYMAPAVLAVAGISSYLFAQYARSTGVPFEQLLALADRSVVRLTAGVFAFGVVAMAAASILGPVLTGGKYDLSMVALAGWAAYAAATAGVTPYGQLASVRGRHVAVFTVRVVDSVCSLIGIYVVVALTDSVEWAPVVMAGSSLLGGLVIREAIIKRDLIPSERSNEGNTGPP